jgi:hypothetical protein
MPMLVAGTGGGGTITAGAIANAAVPTMAFPPAFPVALRFALVATSDAGVDTANSVPVLSPGAGAI